jgi:hypothetical protein
MPLFRYDSSVILNAPTYQAMGGVNCFVCSQPSNANQIDPDTTPIPPSPLATIFADSSGTPLSNPLTTDSSGQFYFYALPNAYDLVVFDPFGRLSTTFVYLDQNVGVASGGSSLAFQTNGTPNTNQGLLNLIAGSGISATADAFGGVTLVNTGAVPVSVNANLVSAGPASGSAALPTYRSLAAPDIPVATGSASGAIILTGDFAGTSVSPQVVSTHLTAPLPNNQGGTAANLAATGGTSQVLKQVTVGGAVTVGQLAFTDISGIIGAVQMPFGQATIVLTGSPPTAPVFLATGNASNIIVLTSSVASSTITGGTAGQPFTLIVKQDAVGSRAFVFPPNFKGVGTISGTASGYNVQSFVYDGTNFLASSSMQSFT